MASNRIASEPWAKTWEDKKDFFNYKKMVLVCPSTKMVLKFQYQIISDVIPVAGREHVPFAILNPRMDGVGW